MFHEKKLRIKEKKNKKETTKLQKKDKSNYSVNEIKIGMRIKME